MLEFVHLSGSEPGKDLKTRRIVRSQAMRDFRRRQRDEREAVKSSAGSHLGNSKKTSLTPQGRLQPNQEPSEGSTPRLRKRISGQRIPSRTLSAPTQGTLLQASSRQRLPVVILENSNGNTDRVIQNQSQRRVRQAHTRTRYCQPSISPDHQSPLATSPSTWYSEMEDPFQSPAQLNRMSAFCKSYIHWLMPGVDSETAECVLSNAWELSQCPMLLAACCLASAAHLDAVQRSRPPGNYALYKARILQEVSERMQSPSSATSDEVIGTLACLLSFELSRGSGEALTHLRGLKSIIKMKGGIHSLSFTHLSSMLETLDLLHAAIFDTDPVFSELRTPIQEQHFSDAETFARWIPLIVAEQEMLQLRGSVYDHTLSRLTDFLEICSRALDGTLWLHQASNNRVHGNETRDRLQDIVDYFDIRGLSQQHEADDTNYLARACYCTSAILYNLVVHQTPHRHRHNKKYADGLLEAVRHTGERAWQDVPYLQLFVLLTGGVASDDPSATSYFQAQIVRLIYQMGLGEFRRVKDFFTKYLAMKRALERPERRSSPPVDLDKPPTTDELYLYTGWSSIDRSNSSTTSLDGSHSYESPILSRDHSPPSYTNARLNETYATPIRPQYHGIDIDSLTNFEFPA